MAILAKDSPYGLALTLANLREETKDVRFQVWPVCQILSQRVPKPLRLMLTAGLIEQIINEVSLKLVMEYGPDHRKGGGPGNLRAARKLFEETQSALAEQIYMRIVKEKKNAILIEFSVAPFIKIDVGEEKKQAKKKKAGKKK